MKISIITVAYNAEEFLQTCIQSVINQTYPDIEYIIIDGGSTDSTVSIIHHFNKNISRIISEKDQGIYDAMNKGIELATGDVVGMLNADDFFADNKVIADVAKAFADNNVDVVYGDLFYVNRKNPKKVIRKWFSKPFSRKAMAWGWMPAHPTFYARRQLFTRFGNYNLEFNSAADYELMLRFLYLNKSNSEYLNRILVIMRMGGVSNGTLYNRFQASLNDVKAMQRNNVSWPWLKIMIKPLRKINQYFNRP